MVSMFDAARIIQNDVSCFGPEEASGAGIGRAWRAYGEEPQQEAPRTCRAAQTRDFSVFLFLGRKFQQESIYGAVRDA